MARPRRKGRGRHIGQKTPSVELLSDVPGRRHTHRQQRAPYGRKLATPVLGAAVRVPRDGWSLSCCPRLLTSHVACPPKPCCRTCPNGSRRPRCRLAPAIASLFQRHLPHFPSVQLEARPQRWAAPERPPYKLTLFPKIHRDRLGISP